MKARTFITYLPLVATALVAACGEEETSVRSSPTAPGDVVVQVLVEGGFVPLELALNAVPSATVLGDGTVITPAPVPAIYPGPAIPPLQSTKVDASRVDALVQRARDLGLLVDGLDFGRPSVADAPNTTITIRSSGRTYQHVAYALDVHDEPGGPSGAFGIGQQAAANRRSLSAFVRATAELPPGREPWIPQKVAVYVLGPYQPEPNLPQTPVSWPLTRPPSTSGPGFPCTLVEGQDVQVLLNALQRANARTPWVVDGTPRSLAFRPVVPGQPGCPS